MKSTRGPIDVRVLQDNSAGMSNLDFSSNKTTSPLKLVHSKVKQRIAITSLTHSGQS